MRVGARDADRAGLQRLAQRIEHGTLKFGQFVEKKHAQMRETFESAMGFGVQALQALGVDADEAAEVAERIRARDAERLQLELAGDQDGARNFFQGHKWIPAPLTPPQREARALNEEAADAIEQPLQGATAAAPEQA